ncbi:MAG: acid phosphatase [Candidatus Eremiobacteraeota bacterium]|nr:acid phosphatase [Candidatus Eremiobacteraeota bacterium]
MKVAILAFALLVGGCLSAGYGQTALSPLTQGPTAVVPPHASFVTIVMMENKDYGLVVGSPDAPYFNKTLAPQGVLLRDSHAVTHPSEPNYLALFSGSTQGIHGDPCPVYFSAPNIATRVAAVGKSFGGYSESMPHDGYAGCYTALYARKHNPWVDFTSVPASDNLVYHGFPSSPQSLVWITPNLCHDTHDCLVGVGDKWFSENLPAIIAWDRAHDGLLIVTWDEADPDKSGQNHIPTLLVGPMVRPGGHNDQRVDHYSVLHTIETIFGVPCIDKECSAPVIGGIWQ